MLRGRARDNRAEGGHGQEARQLLPSEYRTYVTVTARFWPRFSGASWRYHVLFLDIETVEALSGFEPPVHPCQWVSRGRARDNLT